MSDFDILLAAIAGAPALVGARCRGKAHLFDGAQPGEKPEVVAQRHNQALGLCGRCEATERCRDYFNGLPRRKRPTGVVAGQVRQRARPARPCKAAS